MLVSLLDVGLAQETDTCPDFQHMQLFPATHWREALIQATLAAAEITSLRPNR